MQINRLLEIIESSTGPIQALYLFGSAASNHADPDSDVDLAILTGNALTDRQRWALSQDLAVELGRDVDLVDLRTASTVMRSQVLSSGRKLYQRADDPAIEVFEDFAFADYARLNEERAKILADVAARGEIHG